MPPHCLRKSILCGEITRAVKLQGLLITKGARAAIEAAAAASQNKAAT